MELGNRKCLCFGPHCTGIHEFQFSEQVESSKKVHFHLDDKSTNICITHHIMIKIITDKKEKKIQ